MSTLPTLVFIHGSWHQANCWDPLIKLLEAKHQLKCIAVSLASTQDNPAATFKDDLDATVAAVSRETTQGRDVIVIAHSYGGIVGNSCIKGFAKTPNSPPSQGHVVGLILIASGLSLTGMAFMDPFFGHPPPAWRVNKDTGYAELVADPRDMFYHDLPADEAAYWVAQLKTQSLKALFEGAEYTYAGWMDVPAWYIGTIEDHGLPVVAQRLNVGMARAMGAKVEHRELRTSHSPFLSRPVQTMEIIVEAVEDFTGVKVLGAESTKTTTADEPPRPIVRFWQPLTWYRFGVPLAFGHVLGRCFLIFGWGRRLFRSR